MSTMDHGRQSFDVTLEFAQVIALSNAINRIDLRGFDKVHTATEKDLGLTWTVKGPVTLSFSAAERRRLVASLATFLEHSDSQADATSSLPDYEIKRRNEEHQNLLEAIDKLEI